MREIINLLEDTQSFESWKKKLSANGKLRLYRVMNLQKNPVELIKGGHTHLGLCWSYDLEFLMHGDYDFGFGGKPENWFYFCIDVDDASVDWEATEELYTDLNDFEKEVRLLPNRPLKLVGITDHWGKPLDCSGIQGARLDTGAQRKPL